MIFHNIIPCYAFSLTDNSEIPVVKRTTPVQQTPTILTIGNHTFTHEAEDIYGNKNSCNVTVTVEGKFNQIYKIMHGN